MSYNNTVLTVAPHGTPDPWVVQGNGNLYMTFTAGDHIQIWKSDTLVGLREHAQKIIVWRPPPDTDHSDGLWAPELHALNGRWYIYYAAGNPKYGNKSHRMWVLAGPSASEDPCQDVATGAWQFAGPIVGMPPNQWAIDGTTFALNNEMYFCYSGWPFDNKNESDLYQHLFIMKMQSPTQAASQPIEISRPDHAWEKCHDGNGEHGINEGPQFLASPDGSWRGIIYSCSGSWTNEYKLAILEYTGGDPLNADSWKKHGKPLIENGGRGTPPYGPGHGSFINLGGETMCVYHATDSPTDGWENRKARCQRVTWTRDGPHMGGCCGPLTDNMDMFVTGNVPQGSHGDHGSHGDQGSSNSGGLRGFFHDAKTKLRDL